METKWFFKSSERSQLALSASFEYTAIIHISILTVQGSTLDGKI